MFTNFSVRTTLPRKFLSLTTICVRIITYDFFLYEVFLYERLSRRTSVITNILQTYFIPYEHLYTNFSERTFTYLRIFVRRTLSLTDIYNICIRTFSIRTFFYTNFCPDEFLSLRIFNIRTLYHTNIWLRTQAYDLLRTKIFHAKFIPYEQLRTNFMHTNYLHTYFGPRTPTSASSI